MSNFYKLMQILQEKQIHICFQSHYKSRFFNLAVTDPRGQSQYYHSDDINKVEQFLMVMWGHLLNKPSMPRPAGMPKPPSM